jgi:membrane protease YdiL (CAAX protease family)
MMNESIAPMTPLAPAEPAEGRRLIAPLWHTAVLIAFLLGMAAYGAYAQHEAGPGPQLVTHHDSALKLYLVLILSQWALLRYVTVLGLKRTGTRLRDLIGQRWSGWKDVARDVAIALVVWAVWTGVEAFIVPLFGKDTAKSIDSLLPRGPLEIAVWVVLSSSAGFCEEAVFRGYLQKQFQALTGSALAAVLIQAVIFGVSHGYQGLRNVIAITAFGALFGILAWWRKSLKPGMILHAWTDIFSGIFAARV